MNESNCIMPQAKQPVIQKECILAKKIYDQCRFQDYVRIGPVISAEKNECIILHPEIGRSSFGGIVWPGKPVRFPKWVKKIRCADGSFKPERITISSITPSPLKGLWDISIEFVFVFKLLLFGEYNTPIQIVCCPNGSNVPEQSHTKETLTCSATYILQTTLSSPPEEEAYIASDILPHQDYSSNASPHVLVQTRAEPENFRLFKPQFDCYQDMPDDCYHEPFCYCFVCIALQADISLFRFVCMVVKAEMCAPIPECPKPCTDPCALFEQIEFPENDFRP